MPGLSLPLEQDLSSYKKKIKVAGIRLPGRMVACFAAAIATSAALGCWMVFLLGIDPTWISLVFPAVSIVFFLYGFYEHNDFAPEQYLPLRARGLLSGRATQYRSSIYMFYDIPKVKEDRLDPQYRKARRKRGAQAAEIRLGRAGEEEEGAERRAQEDEVRREADRHRAGQGARG